MLTPNCRDQEQGVRNPGPSFHRRAGAEQPEGEQHSLPQVLSSLRQEDDKLKACPALATYATCLKIKDFVLFVF